MFSSATFLEVMVRGSLKTDTSVLKGITFIFTYMGLKMKNKIMMHSASRKIANWPRSITVHFCFTFKQPKINK
jgi:hypothetical protein